MDYHTAPVSIQVAMVEKHLPYWGNLVESDLLFAERAIPTHLTDHDTVAPLVNKGASRVVRVCGRL